MKIGSKMKYPSRKESDTLLITSYGGWGDGQRGEEGQVGDEGKEKAGIGAEMGCFRVRNTRRDGHLVGIRK